MAKARSPRNSIATAMPIPASAAVERPPSDDWEPSDSDEFDVAV